MQTNTFWLDFGGLSLAVTLKIRSMSQKPFQLFIISKCYIHANLVKIRQLVHEFKEDPHSTEYWPKVSVGPPASY